MIFNRVVYRMDKRGFTFLELLLVIVIIATLLGLAFLSYNSIMDRLNAERQMKEMYTDLMNARVRAMQRNRTHFVVFTASPSGYTIYEDTDPAPDGDGTLTVGSDTMFQQKNLMSKFPLTWPSTWTANLNLPLQFNAKGLVPTDPDIGLTVPGTVRISSVTTGEYDCLVVSEVKITLGKWNDTAIPPTCIGK